MKDPIVGTGGLVTIKNIFFLENTLMKIWMNKPIPQ